MNSTQQPVAHSERSLTADEQDELVHHLRVFMQPLGGDDDAGEEYVERYATPDLQSMGKAREHAERYRTMLKGCQTKVVVEQRNTRIVFVIHDPPPLI